MVRQRPDVLRGKTYKVRTGCGNLYVTVNADEEELPFEVFAWMGKAGGCASSQTQAIGRLVSVILRGGLDIQIVIDQLKGISCSSMVESEKKVSCAHGVAVALEKFHEDNQSQHRGVHGD